MADPERPDQNTPSPSKSNYEEMLAEIERQLELASGLIDNPVERYFIMERLWEEQTELENEMMEKDFMD